MCMLCIFWVVLCSFFIIGKELQVFWCISPFTKEKLYIKMSILFVSFNWPKIPLSTGEDVLLMNSLHLNFHFWHFCVDIVNLIFICEMSQFVNLDNFCQLYNLFKWDINSIIWTSNCQFNLSRWVRNYFNAFLM